MNPIRYILICIYFDLNIIRYRRLLGGLLRVLCNIDEHRLRVCLQDPDYIQQRSVTLARPSLTNHQSLVRNEHYFATLAKQEGSRTINQGYLRQNLHNNATKNNKSPIATCEDWIYWKDPKQEEPHLNILENPLTEI